MGERLAFLYSNVEKASNPEGCPKEDNFVELYEHLGDQKKQDEIRAANWTKNHCGYLEQNPNCCNVFYLEQDPHSAFNGKMCPLNPRHPDRIAKEKKKFNITEDDEELMYLAQMLYESIALVPTNANLLTCEQYNAALIAKERDDVQTLKLQSMLIAQEIAKILGAKKKDK